jgi:hypothetical protein
VKTTGRRCPICKERNSRVLDAERYEFFANDPTKAEKRRFNELDAARARGWAARLRAGWTAPAGPAKVDETQTEPVW